MVPEEAPHCRDKMPESLDIAREPIKDTPKYAPNPVSLIVYLGTS
jgi:hypothetical protein